MKVADTIIVTPAAASPVIPVAAESVRPIADGGKAARDRRDAGQQQAKATSFRAALDAATISGFSETPGTFAGSTAASTDAAPPERRPSGQVEIDRAEADGLYRAAQAQSAPAGEARFPREYFTASREYAQRYFSVGGTHAARGESLELRA